MQDNRKLFKILGIEPTYDKMAIRRAFVKATKKNHPDHGGSGENLASIKEAYNSLICQTLNDRKVLHCTIPVELHHFLFGGTLIAEVTLDGDLTMVEFEIEAYTQPGSQIQISKKCLTETTIYATLNEMESSVYRRFQSKIVVTETISKHEAIQGVILDLLNYDGTKHIINVPPNTTASRLIYKVPEAGFFAENSKTRDELVIIIEIE